MAGHPEVSEKLTELFKNTAQAMWDDGEVNVPLPVPGSTTRTSGANGVNSFEAGTVLDYVAWLLGMKPPHEYLQELEDKG